MLNLAKIGLFGMFLNYYPYNIMFGHFIPHGTYLFFMLIVIGFAGDTYLNNRSRIHLDREIWGWVLYLLASLVTSVFAVSPNVAIASLEKYAMRLFVIIAIVHICRREGTIKFSINLLAITAILSALTAFIQMDGLHGRLSLVTDASISVNDFGAMMAYGCFAVILYFRYGIQRTDFGKAVFTIVSSVLLLTELFIAGSRKSFVAIIILYGLLIVFVWRKYLHQRFSKVFSVFLLLLIAAFLVNKYLIPYLGESSLYQRLWGYKAEEAQSGNSSRVWLYQEALSTFLEHPLFGLGFDNFTVVNLVYTHSTYAEPIACSGIFSLLYLFPLLDIFICQWLRARYERKRRHKYYIEAELLIFYIVFLIVGAGIPYIYKEVPCIVFGMMIAHQHIPYDVKLREYHG